MATNVPVGYPDRPPYQPTTAELDAAAAHVAVLDASGQGFGAAAMRTFYPNQGWNVINALLNGLVQRGTLKKTSKRMPTMKVAVDWYTTVK